MWNKKNIKVPVEVSARHCHLCQKDLDALFGAGYELKKIKQLSQPSDFACDETVDIEFGSKKIERIRIVGPIREQTQIEISLTDATGSGISVPVRLSGELEESALVVVRGPKGVVELKDSLICALRHIHCATGDAAKLGLKNGAKVSVLVKSIRPVIFEDVVVRVSDNYELCMHIDTDEGNAAGINKIGEGVIL
jgi:putative phosphotransacetylase